ncbi:DUF6695 family protein [Robertkochia solimangrovi]|uniref:DUF6695 family protein n=1 Tax=Robertkochia solimangrovi TaxID=2213046 RepID=UPI00117CA4A9|nr:DUF6695 family protein [Robertkochia solimangrovi]TRZ41627.1 hypothetical protein DMZ48_16595 [Robertkochia solimangrovi]
MRVVNEIGRNGFAVAVAWPDFMGKQAGSWYDPLMRFLGLNRNFHYKVGHAALVLVDQNGRCFYFDCGRYEAPFQKGRIRDVTTDCGLHIETIAKVSRKRIENIRELLTEIQLNDTCKGFGVLKAAYCKVNFESAYSAVKRIQAKGIIPFGPFIRPGTNCCRFVKNAIAMGSPEFGYRWKLKLLFPLLPKPLTLINLLSEQIHVPERETLPEYRELAPMYRSNFDTRKYYNHNNVNKVIRQPRRPLNVPADSQWVGGEMSGSWFHLSILDDRYEITRYSENGSKKCSGFFEHCSESLFEIEKPFSFGFLSHCSSSLVIQDDKIFEFKRIT